MKDVLILGGGISGLAAAYRMRNHANVTLLEAEEKCGGLLEFPRIFKASRSPHLLQLISDVGLESELIFSHPSAKKRYLWHRGKLTSIGSVVWPYLGRLLLEPFIPKGKGEETIKDFTTRRFGKKLAHLLFEPLTLGIYGSDFGELSCQSCFPQFAEWEERFGSVLLGGCRTPRSKRRFPGSLFTLKCGMEKLVDALLFPGIHTKSKVTLLEKKKLKWRVVCTREREYEADTVFAALPAHALELLLPGMPTIPYSSLSVVHIQLPPHAFLKSGFGYLVPSSEKEALLGMIWDSAVFPELGLGKMTAMVRPGFDPERVVLDALQKHLGCSEMPDSMRVRQIEQAIPKLLPGHATRLSQWRDGFKGLYLLGNYIDGVSVEHCIAQALKLSGAFFLNEL